VTPPSPGPGDRAARSSRRSPGATIARTRDALDTSRSPASCPMRAVATLAAAR
jgi:hypothetical protein